MSLQQFLESWSRGPGLSNFLEGISYATHTIYIMVRRVDPGEPGSFDPLKICRRGHSMFWPPESHILYFKTVVEQLCKFHIIKDERLVPKMKGKTNFSKRHKRFDGLTRQTLNPVFYDRSTPLHTVLLTQQQNLLHGNQTRWQGNFFLYKIYSIDHAATDALTMGAARHGQGGARAPSWKWANGYLLLLQIVR